MPFEEGGWSGCMCMCEWLLMLLLLLLLLLCKGMVQEYVCMYVCVCKGRLSLVSGNSKKVSVGEYGR